MNQPKEILIRIVVVFSSIFIISVGIIFSLFKIQFGESSAFKEKAENYITEVRDIPATRGNIYSDNGSLLATSIPVYEIRMDFKSEGFTDDVFKREAGNLAISLANFFKDKSAEDYFYELKQARKMGKRYYLLKRDINYNQLKVIREFPIFNRGRVNGGVIFEKQTKRELPFNHLAARTIGYDNGDGNQKRVGIEGAFAAQLRGRDGKRLEKRITGGVWMPVSSEQEVEPIDGAHVHTTIDVNIQDVAEHALKKQLALHEARHGCVVVMEVKTGYVKAMANLTNHGNGKIIEDLNYALRLSEPGSTFKLPALMSALEEGLVDLDDKVNTESGKIKYYDRWMRDSNDKGYGEITIQHAFEKSSNVGISKVIYNAFKNHPDKFIERLYKMSVNQPLEISIEGEQAPQIKTTRDRTWSGTSLPWMSIGYELMMTPLQILTFYNAVANDGVKVKPQFVSHITRRGEILEIHEPLIIKDRIASRSTIDKAKIMLEGVVEEGTGSNLKNANFKIAGKTGTAQIAFDGGYGEKGKRLYQASFVGYFPADNPQYSCIVVITEPTKEEFYGNRVAGPIFKEIADKLYAQRLDLHKDSDLAENENAKAPISKNGSHEDLAVVFESMGVQTKVENLKGPWVSTHTQSTSVEMVGSTILISKVPNVQGMNIMDAIYILENRGLKVRYKGTGTIKKQSLQPGENLVKNQTIYLDLS